MEKQGLLKRSDDIQTYIPWLTLTYNGKKGNHNNSAVTVAYKWNSF
ncbi:hypothetical protein OL548_29200 [Lysinibacillus sp. MHQ-1]|nr:hypothetical protein OL548_29200 [Lysinibacillus sp. MHQ-1]